jgi:membrane protein EpsK
VDTKLRVIVNSVCNVTGRVVSVIIGLFLTPFMLKRLGPKAFGIIPLIMSSVLPFLDIFTAGVSASVGRYVTFHHARKETEEANRYFNTSFFALLGLCALASLPILILSYYFPSIFRVKTGWETRSQWTMLVAGVGFIVNAASAAYGVGLYYRQRFDLSSAFEVTAALARAGTIVLLFSLVGANTVYVSVGMIVGASIIGVTNVATAYRMLPGLRTSWRFFSSDKLKDVSAFSFFLVISLLGARLLVSTDYMLINWLIGEEAVTVYNLGARWALLLKWFLGAGVFVLGPLVTIWDATDRLDHIRDVFLRGARLAFLTLAPLTLFTCVLAKPFLRVWIGNIYPEAVEPAVQVLWVMVLPLVINLSVVHALVMFNAMGRVRLIALVTLAAALANIGLSIWLAVGLKLGILGIALGSTICLLAKNAAFTPWYMCRLCRTSLRHFYRLLPAPIVACLPGTAAGILIQYVTDINNWGAIILVGIGCFMSYLPIMYLWCLTDEERAALSAGWARIRAALGRRQEQNGE